VGSNPGEDDGFVIATEIRRRTYFGCESKPSVPCNNILRRVKEPCRSEKRYYEGKIHSHFSASFSCFAIRCLCLLPVCSGAWMRNDQNSDDDAQQMRNGRSARKALCDTTPYSNSNHAYNSQPPGHILSQLYLVTFTPCFFFHQCLDVHSDRSDLFPPSPSTLYRQTSSSVTLFPSVDQDLWLRAAWTPGV
jgi:hypothetical protein